jgi:hypothetical protein
LRLRPRAASQLVIILVVILLLGSSAFGQTRKYRSITWEKLKASGPELKQIGWLAVRHAKEIESSPWSVGCETLDRDQARFSVYKDCVGELGVKHARLQSGWAKCEKQKGVYDFAWLDEEDAASLRAHPLAGSLFACRPGASGHPTTACLL